MVKAMLLCILLGIVSACASGNKNDNTEGPNGSGREEPIELTIATPSGHTDESFRLRFGDSIRKKFPHYTIRFISAQTMKFPDIVATKTHVDMVYAAVSDFSNNPVQYEMVDDLSALIKSHNIDLNRTSVKWLDALAPVWKGNIYGLPVSLESQATFYNKSLFDKFGVSYPVSGLNWEEAFELNRKLTRLEDGTHYIGLSIAQAQHFSLNALSLPYVDPQTEKSSLSNEMDKWKSIYETIALRPLDAAGYRDAMKNDKDRLPGEQTFRNQHAAMLVGLVHSPLSYKEMEEIDWDITSYPTYRQAPNTGAQGNLLLFGITKMSPYKNQAMEVIKYMYSDEFQTITSGDGNIPVVLNDTTKKAFAQNTYYKDRNVQSVFSIPYAPLSSRTVYDSEVGALYRKYLVDLAYGNMDMNTMLSRIEEEVNQIIEAKKRGSQ